MVDAGTKEIYMVFGDADVAADEVERGLHSVAKADELDFGGSPEAEAVRTHRVGVVEKERVGAKLLHVFGDVEEDGNGAEAAENTAGAERVADALVDAECERDFVVDFEGVEATDLNHDDDVIGAVEGFAAVERGGDFCGELIFFDDAVEEAFHGVELGFGAVHEAEFGAFERVGGEDVHGKRFAEDETACANHCDFRHITLLG